MKHILQLFPPHLRKEITPHVQDSTKLEEIRLRINQPIELNFYHTYVLLDEIVFKASDAQYFIRQLSEHSLYRLENELQAGFITTKGGHRVGFSGMTTILSATKVRLQHLTFFNIRIAKEIKDIAKPIVPYLLKGNRFMHTLLFGAPQTGKTTLLRDISREISAHYRQKIAIIDERSEITASINGVPQLDVGLRTDVMDACPKQLGMMMMIRTMSPHILIVDEIGSKEDVHAIFEAINAGVTIICTIHCDDYKELKQKQDIAALINLQIFERFLYLNREKNHALHVNVLNEDGHTLHERVLDTR